MQGQVCYLKGYPVISGRGIFQLYRFIYPYKGLCCHVPDTEQGRGEDHSDIEEQGMSECGPLIIPPILKIFEDSSTKNCQP